MVAIPKSVAMATLVVFALWAFPARGGPLQVKDKKHLLYQFIREDSFKLMHLVSITHADFAHERFKDEHYDHFIKLPGIEPVVNYATLSEETFLKKQVDLFYKFKQMFIEVINHEPKNPTTATNFRDKFQEILNLVNDILASLRHTMNLNYPVTNSMPVYPTMKPKATQKEQDEWTLMVLKELLLSLIPLEHGAEEKMRA